MRKKKIVALFPFLLLLLMLVHLNTVEASETIQYKSNGSTSFYGEYVFTEENNNSDPSTQSGGNTNSNGYGGGIGVLPTTGDEQSVFMIISGLILLGGSSVYLLKRRMNIQ